MFKSKKGEGRKPRHNQSMDEQTWEKLVFLKTKKGLLPAQIVRLLVHEEWEKYQTPATS